MDLKFYLLDVCPHCEGDLKDAGKSKVGNKVLSCIKCGQLMLEDDINKIRESRKDEEEI